MKNSKIETVLNKSNKSTSICANYSKKDAASILGVSSRTMDNLIFSRKIEHVRIGRRIVFTPDQIQRFIEKNTIKAC